MKYAAHTGENTETGCASGRQAPAYGPRPPAPNVYTFPPSAPRWYDEPDSFRPERFSKENEKLLPKYAYLPFSNGPRVCIGNSFATMEATLILATIAQQYRLQLTPGQQAIPQATLTLRPRHNLRMALETRQSAAEHDIQVSQFATA